MTVPAHPQPITDSRVRDILDKCVRNDICWFDEAQQIWNKYHSSVQSRDQVLDELESWIEKYSFKPAFIESVVPTKLLCKFVAELRTQGEP